MLSVSSLFRTVLVPWCCSHVVHLLFGLLCLFRTWLSHSMFVSYMALTFHVCFVHGSHIPCLFRTRLSHSMFVSYTPLTFHVCFVHASHIPCLFRTRLSHSMFVSYMALTFHVCFVHASHIPCLFRTRLSHSMFRFVFMEDKKDIDDVASFRLSLYDVILSIGGPPSPKFSRVPLVDVFVTICFVTILFSHPGFGPARIISTDKNNVLVPK